MSKLLVALKKDHPKLVFRAHERFYWSPNTGEVFYDKARIESEAGEWALLHEVGHAILGHQTYESDVELVKLEAAAWEKAKEIGKTYNITLSEDHIQDCMDTYRDWLHQRSACPRCNTRSLQQDASTYKCFNCGQIWRVSSSRFCRPYRMSHDKTKTPPSSSKPTFV